MKNLEVIDSGVKYAHLHMSFDHELLNNLQNSKTPILHFYDWMQDTATYGYFVDPQKYLNMDAVKKHRLELAKRPTGGGIVFHLTDFAFSILLPSTHPNFSLNPMENYSCINGLIKEAILKFSGTSSKVDLLHVDHSEKTSDAKNFCMAKPTKYDILLGGLKIGGGAERLTKFGLLHQGTIALTLPQDDYLKEILKSETILDCMKKNSCLLLGENACKASFTSAKKELKNLLLEAFSFSDCSKNG